MITTKALKPNEVLGINPLTIAGFVVNANKVIFTDSYVKSEGGALIDYKSHLVEYDTSAKVYNKAEYRKFVAALPPAAKSLFIWLIYEIELNKDYIKINRKRYMLENSVKSVNTYKGAIDILTRYCVIYEHLEM